MAAQLRGQQISALLESLPGIASVLRSPVADAIVSTIRAAVGLGEFSEGDANELVQFAVRRGLVGSEEGEQLLAEVKDACKNARAKARAKNIKKKATVTAKAKRSVKKKAKVKTPKAVARKTTTKKTKATKSRPKKAKKKR
ncbi:MAG: hypothetical protein IIA55_07330 [Gemmatimonadetes bacterium]|nr:hypothetical protein [Gemmatimonadota bacterium]